MSFKHVTDEILSGYLSGELTAREKYDADSHFTICPECSAKLEKQRAFEKKIAAAYNSSFPLYLSPDAHCAVSEEINAGFSVNGQAPYWQKRILIKFSTQVASVTLVAALVAVMILTQSQQTQQTVPVADVAPAAAPAPVQKNTLNVAPVQTNTVQQPVQVKSIVKESVVALKKESAIAEKVKKTDAVSLEKQKIAAPAAKITVPSVPAVVSTPVPAPSQEKKVVIAAVSKPAPQVPQMKKIPASPVKAPAVKTNTVADPLLQFHPSLIKLFRVDQIVIRKKSDKNFILQGVKSPFADDLYVIYAASGVPEKQAARKVKLTLSAAGKMVFASSYPAMQNDVCVMSFRSRTLPDEIGKLESMIEEGQEKQSSTLLIGKEIISADFNTAPEQVRLAAVLHAASVPRLILKRDVRAGIIAQLEKLLSGGYADDLHVKALYDQLKRGR